MNWLDIFYVVWAMVLWVVWEAVSLVRTRRGHGGERGGA
jgi:hypothetical protein